MGGADNRPGRNTAYLEVPGYAPWQASDLVATAAPFLVAARDTVWMLPLPQVRATAMVLLIIGHFLRWSLPCYATC